MFPQATPVSISVQVFVSYIPSLVDLHVSYERGKYAGEVKATRSAVKTLLNSLKGCKGRARHQNYCEKGCTAGQIFCLFNEVLRLTRIFFPGQIADQSYPAAVRLEFFWCTPRKHNFALFLYPKDILSWI